MELIELILMILEVWMWSGIDDRITWAGDTSLPDPKGSPWKLYALALFLGGLVGLGSFFLTRGLLFKTDVARWSAIVIGPPLTALAACLWQSRKALPDSLDWTSFWVVLTFSAVVGLTRFGLHTAIDSKRDLQGRMERMPISTNSRSSSSFTSANLTTSAG